MSEPVDPTHELLRQIRADQAAFRTEIERRFSLMEHRFDGLESDVLEIKRTMRGITYMVATFTGRLEDAETRVDRLAPS